MKKMPVKRLWVKVNKCPVKMDPTMTCICNRMSKCCGCKNLSGSGRSWYSGKNRPSGFVWLLRSAIEKSRPYPYCW